MTKPIDPSIPEIPIPRTRAEFSALLDRALAEADKLSAMVDKVFPGAASVPPVNLEGLTLDEKMAMGDRVCDELGALAFKISPSAVLDHLEKDLSGHEASRQEAEQVLANFAR